MINEKNILLVGDHHGNYDAIFRILDRVNVENCSLICVGDGGEGFSHPEKTIREFNHMNDRFAKRNIEYFAIRGNHSNPKYFDGSINLSHFKLIPDYTKMDIDGQKWLFVGGAISVDRIERAPGLSWWEDEEFKLDISKVEKCDVLVTHSGPSWIGPFNKDDISYWCKRDPTLWEECKKERADHDMLVKLCQPKQLFLGHFHMSKQEERDGCTARILDINEIMEYRRLY